MIYVTNTTTGIYNNCTNTNTIGGIVTSQDTINSIDYRVNFDELEKENEAPKVRVNDLELRFNRLVNGLADILVHNKDMESLADNPDVNKILIQNLFED